MFLWLKTLYRKRAVTWPFIFTQLYGLYLFLNTDKEVLLKSLHVCLGIPILVFNEDYTLVEEYRSDRTISLFYDFPTF